METIVNPRVIADLDALRQRFAEAKPFRHVVIDDFFSDAFVRQLLAEFPSFERGNSVGEDGKPGNKSTLEKIRALGPGFAALDTTIQRRDFLDVVGKITDIDRLLYDPFYLGGGTHENRHGQDLQAHIDFNYHPSERWHRRLNLIVYLNPEWDAAWGGNLQLFDDPYRDAAPAASIVPALNRCVIFETTEHSWHAFDRIALPPDRAALSRKSIALYFYSEDRPAEQQAGKHTTHYVNRQLPEHFVAGHTLDTVDVALLQEMIARRDGQLQRLYAENASLLQAQERGFGGHLLYLLKRLYVRYRR